MVLSTAVCRHVGVLTNVDGGSSDAVGRHVGVAVPLSLLGEGQGFLRIAKFLAG
jgi:hypothetical protein